MNSLISIKDLYLHIPFCTGKCAYCAFHSYFPPTHPAYYVDRLITASQPYISHLSQLETLYCGGGTPGLLGVDGFKHLRQAPFMVFASNYEWTVELHPTTCTQALLETLATLGVNRISIGVQSFDDATLLRCHRRHTVKDAISAIQLARSIIPDTGIDLIAGLPGVTQALWEKTLEQALSFDLPHLSIYGLSIDEGSQWYREGIKAPEEDFLCDAIAFAEETLAKIGLERYETSNYAKPGYRCKHNLNTWRGGDYLGLGEGAVSRLGLHRIDGMGKTQILTPLDDALERALTHLRLKDGFSIDTLMQRFPMLEACRTAWQTHLQQLQKYQLLDFTGAPTTRGYEVLDAITRSFYDIVAASQSFSESI